MANTNKYGLTRKISAKTIKKVQKHCGHCCVICGNVPYQLHHFDTPYAESTEHNANKITLLCCEHHNEVTAGRLTNNCISKANAEPYYSKNQRSQLSKWIPWEASKLSLGGTNICSLDIIQTTTNRQPYNKTTVLGFSRNDYGLVLQANLEYFGIPLQIISNQLIAGEDCHISLISNRLVIKHKNKQVFEIHITQPTTFNIQALILNSATYTIVALSSDILNSTNPNTHPSFKDLPANIIGHINKHYNSKQGITIVQGPKGGITTLEIKEVISKSFLTLNTETGGIRIC